ncbi:hemerythrin domain-containing protein [Nonomuraea sp. NPDC003201]
MAPNMLGFRITHRAMRGDARRLATLMSGLAAGEERADPARLHAIATFATKLCAGIHHHHQAEDDVLWPVIVRSAGAEVGRCSRSCSGCSTAVTGAARR